jgi:hypothetical protein
MFRIAVEAKSMSCRPRSLEDTARTTQFKVCLWQKRPSPGS